MGLRVLPSTYSSKLKLAVPLRVKARHLDIAFAGTGGSYNSKA